MNKARGRGNPHRRPSTVFLVDGQYSKSITAARKRAQSIANRTGKTVYVEHYAGRGGYKFGETVIRPSAGNPRKLITSQWKPAKVRRVGGKVQLMMMIYDPFKGGYRKATAKDRKAIKQAKGWGY